MAFVTVEGTVENVFFDGRGIKLSESYTDKQGEARKSYFTAWFDVAPGLTVGEFANFSGILSTRIGEFEGRDGTQKQVAEVNINKARVKQGISSDQAKAEAEAAPARIVDEDDLRKYGAPF